MKRKIWIFIMILPMLLLNGCFNRTEPKSLAIMASSLNDLNEDKTYTMTMEIFNPTAPEGGGQGGSQSKNSVIIVTSNGKTPPEAIRAGTSNVARMIFTGQVQVRFYTERLAREDISALLDFFLRDHTTRQSPFMLVVKGDKPEQLYSCETGLSDSMGVYIDVMAKSVMKATSESVFPTTLDFMKAYYNDGIQPVMGAAEIVPDTASQGSSGSSGASGSKEEKYTLKCGGLAAFKDNRLVGFLDNIETRAYNMIVGDFGKASVSVPAEGKNDSSEFTILEISGVKPEIITSFNNEQANINVNIKLSVNVQQETDNIDIQNKKIENQIESDFNMLIKGQLEQAIEKAQKEFKSDIFGFGVQMHIQHPAQWKNISNNWDDYFSNATVNVNVKSSIIKLGDIKEPYEMGGRS